MDWKSANSQTPHKHIEIDTPIGRGVIEMKDWHDGLGDDDRWLGISVDGEYVGEVGDYPGDLSKLDGYVVEARGMLDQYLRKKRDELDVWLGDGWFTLADKAPEGSERVLIEVNTGSVVVSRRDVEEGEGVWTDDDERFSLDDQIVRWRYLPK